MKTGLRIAVLCTIALAAAYGDKVQAADVTTRSVATDGRVPSVADPVKPVVNGQEMTRRQFLDKYRTNLQQAAQTPCVLVLREQRKSSTDGPMPKW